MHDPWNDRLSEYLEGELSPTQARALEAHLAGCASCRDELEMLRRVLRAAGGLRLPRVMGGLSGKTNVLPFQPMLFPSDHSTPYNHRQF